MLQHEDFGSDEIREVRPPLTIAIVCVCFIFLTLGDFKLALFSQLMEETRSLEEAYSQET